MKIEMNYNIDEFKKLASDGKVIPIFTEFACDGISPVALFSRIDKDFSFILESVENSEQIGRHSIVGCSPRFLAKFEKGHFFLNDVKKGNQKCETGDPLEQLKKAIHAYEPIGYEGLPYFMGGAVGYLGYDIIATIESLEMENEDGLNVPDMAFIFPQVVIVFDHFNHTVKLINNVFIDANDPIDELYEQACSTIENLIKLFSDGVDLSLFSLSSLKEEDPNFNSSFSKEEFYEVVQKAKEYIHHGEAIQVVLSQRLEMEYTNDPLNLYRALRVVNPSPYMFHIRFENFSLVGASPEILVKEEDGNVTIRPIAGTRKRGGAKQRDIELEKELIEDKKEIAEHVMLVDLARNDIGRVCKPGTVKPDQLMVVERYSHVMHIVSNVIGQLDDKSDAFDLIKATFPAGTVSGAPKVRAMEIIEELEKTKRGPYAGAVCYFGYDGNFDSCITIRTVLVKDNIAHVQVGAGIVFDSEPELEYKETLNKGRAMLKAINMAHKMAPIKED